MRTPVLSTPRLRLGEMRLSDLDFVAAMLADAEVMRFYPRCYSRDEARAWVERQLERYARDGHGLWLVEDRSTGEPVGQVGLVIQTIDGAAEAEIGYLVHRPFWRRGLAAEAAAAVRDHAFGRLRKERVISLIRPDNVASQGVARKLGMRVEKQAVFAGVRHDVWSLARATSPAT